jgi:hypothetical protein
MRVEADQKRASSQRAEKAGERDEDDFSLFGIPDESMPPYTNAREFSRNFRRCSILKMDEVRYALATGADICRPSAR